MLKKITYMISAFVCAAAIGTTAYGASDRLVAVSDSRVIDAYTGLIYGAVCSDYMTSSSGDAEFNGVINVKTTAKAVVKAREDVIDSLKTTEDGVEFKMKIGVLSCDYMEVSAKISETSEKTLWSMQNPKSDITVSVTSKGGKVYTRINGQLANTTECGVTPVVPILSVRNADISITDVSYESLSESVRVFNGTDECTDRLPDAESVTVRIENPRFKHDYLIGAYKDGILQKCKVLTKEDLYAMQETEVPISGADTLKVFKWESIDTMKTVFAPIKLNR